MIVMAPHLANGGPEIDDDELLERVQPGIDNEAAPLVARYRAALPALSNFDLLLAIESDQFRIRSLRLAEHKVAGGTARVYSYLFRWTTDAVSYTHLDVYKRQMHIRVWTDEPSSRGGLRSCN